MPKQHILGDGMLWTPFKYNLHSKMNVSCVHLIDFYRLNLWLALWSISSVISTPAEPLIFLPVSKTAFLKKNRYSDCWVMGYILYMFSFSKYCLFFKVVVSIDTTTTSVSPFLFPFLMLIILKSSLIKYIKNHKCIHTHLSSDSSNCKDRKRYYRSGFREAETRDHRLNLAWCSPNPVTTIPCLWLFLCCFSGRFKLL